MINMHMRNAEAIHSISLPDQKSQLTFNCTRVKNNPSETRSK